jgi:hypothetical protein
MSAPSNNDDMTILSSGSDNIVANQEQPGEKQKLA